MSYEAVKETTLEMTEPHYMEAWHVIDQDRREAGRPYHEFVMATFYQRLSGADRNDTAEADAKAYAEKLNAL